MRPLCCVAFLLLAGHLPAAAGSSAVAAAPAPVSPAPVLKFRWADPADPALAAYRKAGDFVFESVVGRLGEELELLPTQRNPEVVVSRVHLKNYKVPDVPWGSPRVTAVKRTSLRVRNPQNAPDAADRAALEFFRQELATGGPVPEFLLQNVSAEGQPAEMRFYRPMAVRPQCMVCHGPLKSLSPGVRNALEHLYPNDAAVDYVPTEWRGLIRVSFEAPPAAK